MPAEKEHRSLFSSSSLGRTIIILVTLCLVVGSMTAIAYKIYKATRPRYAAVEEVTTIKTEHKKTTVAAVSTDSLRTVKLIQLYTQYFIKDTVPQKVPEFLAEAFMGYEYGDDIYFRKIDLTNIPASAKADSLNLQLILEMGHYYKGISFLLQSDAEQAITNLNWVINNANHLEYVIKSRWYLAMAYLKTQHPEKAMEQLIKVEKFSSHTTYKTKANALLETLGKL